MLVTGLERLRYACRSRQQLYVPFAPPSANRKRWTEPVQVLFISSLAKRLNSSLARQGDFIEKAPKRVLFLVLVTGLERLRYACRSRQQLYVPFAPPSANRKRWTKPVQVLRKIKAQAPEGTYALMVLVTGLEPVRYCYRGILSPLRLPISPHQLI